MPEILLLNSSRAPTNNMNDLPTLLHALSCFLLPCTHNIHLPSFLVTGGCTTNGMSSLGDNDFLKKRALIFIHYNLAKKKEREREIERSPIFKSNFIYISKIFCVFGFIFNIVF